MAGHTDCIGEMHTTFKSEILKGIFQLENQRVDEKIILR
jgi:hypothetical protein